MKGFDEGFWKAYEHLHLQNIEINIERSELFTLFPN